MPKSDAYLALGTNLGDRQANLKIAKDRLSAGIEIVQESSIYETAPWGYADQPKFLNQVIQISDRLQSFHPPLAGKAHRKENGAGENLS